MQSLPALVLSQCNLTKMHGDGVYKTFIIDRENKYCTDSHKVGGFRFCVIL